MLMQGGNQPRTKQHYRRRGQVYCGHADGPHHNCDYVRGREQLIPAAEAEANGRAGARPPAGEAAGVEWSEKWSRIFHATMAELARRYLAVAAVLLISLALPACIPVGGPSDCPAADDAAGARPDMAFIWTPCGLRRPDAGEECAWTCTYTFDHGYVWDYANAGCSHLIVGGAIVGDMAGGR